MLVETESDSDGVKLTIRYVVNIFFAIIITTSSDIIPPFMPFLFYNTNLYYTQYHHRHSTYSTMRSYSIIHRVNSFFICFSCLIEMIFYWEISKWSKNIAYSNLKLR